MMRFFVGQMDNFIYVQTIVALIQNIGIWRVEFLF